MSKNYDHHWRKGYEKPGVRMEIPTEAQRRRKQLKKHRNKVNKRIKKRQAEEKAATERLFAATIEDEVLTDPRIDL